MVRMRTVGRLVGGDGEGRYTRVDLLMDLAENQEEREDAEGVLIRLADDPGMEINCIGEWVEDQAAAEVHFAAMGWQVNWDY
ncbi:hypothetical protein [Streptomyces sp. SYSU K217416]